jgi:hypothetical protein
MGIFLRSVFRHVPEPEKTEQQPQPPKKPHTSIRGQIAMQASAHARNTYTTQARPEKRAHVQHNNQKNRMPASAVRWAWQASCKANSDARLVHSPLVMTRHIVVSEYHAFD